VHHLKLNVHQTSFPIKFNIVNINEIKRTGDHLLSLLIFGYPHHLLWEGTLFRQHLIVNQPNSITFIVKDVCEWYLLFIFFIILFILISIANLPKCLSEGYPCINTNDTINHFISMCCTDTRCEHFQTTQLTCGGKSPGKSFIIL